MGKRTSIVAFPSSSASPSIVRKSTVPSTKPTAIRSFLSALVDILVEEIASLVLLHLNRLEERLEVTRTSPMEGQGLLVPLDGGFHLKVGLVTDAVVEEVETDLRRSKINNQTC
ncbi:hypothetical protein PENTCL1PPCAC_9594, partial [Pristionchus entomophagus]